MSNFPSHIFRQYDIRGVYGRDLTEGVAGAVGWALAGLCRERTSIDSPLVAVGMDSRLSSPTLARAFGAGVISAGGRVLDLGLCPSPLVYFSTFDRNDVDAFAAVTGSHNPPGENGLKLGLGHMTLHSEDIQAIRDRALMAPPIDSNVAMDAPRWDVVSRYQEWCLQHFTPLRDSLKRLGRKIVIAVDSGNGTAGPVLPPILRGIGFTVVDLFPEPDGRFPNHHPDPTLPETLDSLRSCLESTGADLGMAFDGDADRLGVVDERGKTVWGDLLLLILAKSVLAGWREKDAGGEPPLVISEVKASQALYDGVREAGGRALMWKTGHSLIKSKMKETGAVLAGEMSGHMFLADRYYGYDDALYAALRLLEVYVLGLLQREISRLSDLLRVVPALLNTPEIRIPCKEGWKFQVVERFRRSLEGHAREGIEPVAVEIIDVDGVRVRFRSGWGLLRASNTQPVLVMRCEADSEQKLLEYRGFCQELLDEIMDNLREGEAT